MAITITSITSGQNATNLAAYGTNSFTPANNNFYLACVESSGTLRTVSSITTTTGLNFVQLGTVTWNTSYQMTVHRAMKSSGLSAGVMTWNLSGSASRGTWIVLECTGTDTTGVDGAGAFVQLATNNSSVGVTSLTVTLPNAIGAGNATCGFFGANTSNASNFTAGSGYTELVDVASTGEAQEQDAEWRSDGQTTVTITSASLILGGVGIEVKVAGAAAAAPLFQQNPLDGLGVGGGFFSNPLSCEAVEPA